MWGHEDEEGRFVCSGMAERESLLAAYERRSGLSVDPDRLRWYSVLNLYWLVAATRASGVRAATSGMSHLGVMLGFVSAIAADCTHHLYVLMQEA
jgi:aminoglycoside phosphotransferase (APT) family kinase protein